MNIQDFIKVYENVVDENSSVNPLTNYSKSKILNENFIIKNN